MPSGADSGSRARSSRATAAGRDEGDRVGRRAAERLARQLNYLMATALAGEPIPPGAFSGVLTMNIS